MFTKITMIDYKKSLRQRADSRKYCGPYCWTPNDKPGSGIGFYCGKTVEEMDKRGSVIRLRIEEVGESRQGVKAYWCDDFGDETMTPIIARLPRGRGFLAGWSMGAGMCATLGGRVYEDEDEAKRAAHDEAEIGAEKEREHQEEAYKNCEDEEDA